MSTPAFLNQPVRSASGPEGQIPPFREGLGERAPAGELPGADLPVRNIPLPFRDGFAPEPGNPSLPRPGTSDGYPRPPTGE